MIVEGVVVSPRVAAALGPVLARLLRDERARGGRVAAEVAEVIAELDQVGRAHRAAVEARVADADVRGRTSGHSSRGHGSRMRPWVSVGQAAGLLGVSERHVRRWIADGRLAAERAGGRWALDLVDVEELKRDREACGERW